VKTGDVIAVREKSRAQGRVVEALQLAQQVGIPAWVEVDAAKFQGTFKKVPDRDEFAADVNESLIVELYSR
jgi:small subunit ribosomal protein S4